MFLSDPVSRLSTQMTRFPRRSSSSHRCEPRNPAPPVTRQVGIASSVEGRATRRSPGNTRPAKPGLQDSKKPAGTVDESLMPSVRGTRTKRGMRRRLPRIGARRPRRCSYAPRARRPGPARSRSSWAPSRTVFSIAGDNSGNALAVLAGESADRPLLLTDVRLGRGRVHLGRRAAVPRRAALLHDRRARPRFVRLRRRGRRLGPDRLARLTTRRRAAQGDGARDAAALRQPGDDRGRRLRRRGRHRRRGQPGGDAIVAFTRGGPRRPGAPPSSHDLARAVPARATLTPSATSAEAASIGGDGAAVVAWIRSTKRRVRADRQPRRRHEVAARRHGARERRPDDRALADRRGRARLAGRGRRDPARTAQRPRPLLALASGQARRPRRARRRLQLRRRRPRPRVRRLARAARPGPQALRRDRTGRRRVRASPSWSPARASACRRSPRGRAPARSSHGARRPAGRRASLRGAASSRRRRPSPSRSTITTRPSPARPRSPAPARASTSSGRRRLPTRPTSSAICIYQSYDLQEPVG